MIQRRKEACLETHSQQVVKLGFEPNLETIKTCAIVQKGVEKEEGRKVEKQEEGK